jgi:LysM repeat protein
VKNKSHHLLILVLSFVMTIAILMAFLPQSAQAATCVAYYVVQEDDTTPKIAQTYGLKWGEIAKANDLDPSDKLVVGTRLCIPPGDDDDGSPATGGGTSTFIPDTDKNAKISVYISGGRIFLNLSKFSISHVYLVKVRDAQVGIGGWEKLEKVKIKKTTTYDLVLKVPKDLQDSLFLSVCLKDLSSDELICRNAINP